jgi:DNA polymerase-4
MGSDRTLHHDIHSRADIESHLNRSAERVASRLRNKNLLAGGVRVKLKTSNFQLLSRQCTLAEPTDVAATLFAAGASLLDRFEHAGPFRLVGLAAHTLQRADSATQLGLLENTRRRALETTLDAVAEKFPDSALRRARDVDTLADDTADLDFLDQTDTVDKSDP